MTNDFDTTKSQFVESILFNASSLCNSFTSLQYWSLIHSIFLWLDMPIMNDSISCKIRLINKSNIYASGCSIEFQTTYLQFLYAILCAWMFYHAETVVQFQTFNWITSPVTSRFIKKNPLPLIWYVIINFILKEIGRNMKWFKCHD